MHADERANENAEIEKMEETLLRTLSKLMNLKADARRKDC